MPSLRSFWRLFNLSPIRFPVLGERRGRRFVLIDGLKPLGNQFENFSKISMNQLWNKSKEISVISIHQKLTLQRHQVYKACFSKRNHFSIGLMMVLLKCLSNQTPKENGEHLIIINLLKVRLVFSFILINISFYSRFYINTSNCVSFSKIRTDFYFLKQKLSHVGYVSVALLEESVLLVFHFSNVFFYFLGLIRTC